MNVRQGSIAAIAAALEALEDERAVINDLNVYPVPDGDTGTNLALTVRAVLQELQQSAGDGIPAVAAAVTKGSLMGARGNSGVILSQIVRGICDVWARADDLTTAVFKEALAEGAGSAYRAVREPVEGTMLTVIREMATAAETIPDTLGLERLVVAVDEAGRLAVERTTEQLPALQRAGVVDAGGYGLLVLFRGLTAGLAQLEAGGVAAGGAVALRGGGAGDAGTAPAADADAAQGRAVAGEAPQAPAPGAASELSAFRYCTSLLLTGTALDQEAFEAFLEPLGDSALVVGDQNMLKIHVHVNDPGKVLSEAVRLGAVSEIEINDMHTQTRERDERLQRATPPAAGTVAVAVVAGEGNKRLFRELGCHAIVDGGQSMNPSAAQLLDAVEALGADEVVLLPNNGNVILTAEQAAGMSSRNIAVVPTTSLPMGLVAMVAFDPDADGVGNARAMQDAIADVRCAEVTRAVRDSELDGITVLEGQAMGLVEGRLVAAADGIDDAFTGVLQEFARGDAEYVTVLTALNGSGLTQQALEELAHDVLPDAEVHFHDGGQPLYPILASAE